MRKRRTVPFDKKLMNEEAKKFKTILEYSFYLSEDDDEVEAEAEPEAEGEPGDGIEDEAGELGIDPDDMSDADDLGPDAGLDNELDTDEDPDGNGEFDEELPEDPMGGEEGGEDFGEEPMEDEVELDVTELVQAAENAQASADEANAKNDELLNMVGRLEGQIANIDAVTAKIDNLENSMEERMPTPVEKLELMSKNSYPYNLKLTDFWEDKTGAYDVMDTDGEGNKIEQAPEEYVLTQDDVDDDYQESKVRDSLNSNIDDEDDEFTEERIY